MTRPRRRGRAHRLVRAALLTLVGVGLLWAAFAGRVLVRAGAPGRVDAVFVLSGFRHGERARAGAGALEASGAGRIVVFVAGDADARPEEVTSFLAGLGVPPDRVRVVGPVRSTAEEAGRGAALARRCGWDRVAVVTSPYHTRRAGLLFRRAVDGVDVRPVATDEPFHPWTWWLHGDDRRAVLGEWFKGAPAVLGSAPREQDPGIPC